MTDQTNLGRRDICELEGRGFAHCSRVVLHSLAYTFWPPTPVTTRERQLEGAR